MKEVIEMSEIFLTSTEFANAIGVSLSTIKNWDRDDILHPYMRTPTGKRLYTQAQVESYFRKYRIEEAQE